MIPILPAHPGARRGNTGASTADLSLKSLVFLALSIALLIYTFEASISPRRSRRSRTQISGCSRPRAARTSFRTCANRCAITSCSATSRSRRSRCSPSRATRISSIRSFPHGQVSSRSYIISKRWAAPRSRAVLHILVVTRIYDLTSSPCSSWVGARFYGGAIRPGLLVIGGVGLVVSSSRLLPEVPRYIRRPRL